MLEKLASIEDKYHELSGQLSDPAVISDQPLFQKLAKAQAAISDLIEVYQEYKLVKADLTTAAEMLGEETNKSEAELLEAEIKELKLKEEALTEKLKLLLIPKDPNDDKNVVMEIRAGTGGDEAAIFAGDLFRMYSSLC